MNLSRYHFESARVSYFLIGINVAVYMMELIVGQELIFYQLGLVPIILKTDWNVYTLLTSIYLHVDPLHLIMNVFALWIFGPACEREMGERKFLIFYNVAGIAGGIAHVIAYPYSFIPIMGASGAIFGIVAAFAVLFPLRPILVFFFFPMVLPAALWAVLYFLLEIVYEFSGINPYIAHMAHIGGFVAGLIFALIYRKVSRPWKRRQVKIVWVEE
ncbi:MAG: rhomboid family intramembrane serine protease [Thermoproteota archaeon]